MRGLVVCSVILDGEEIKLYNDQYADGTRALVAFGVYGESYGALSVKLGNQHPVGACWIKAWGENAGLAQVVWATGAFEKVGETLISTPGGSVKVEAWKTITHSTRS
jgi:hypothetical protein